MSAASRLVGAVLVGLMLVTACGGQGTVPAQAGADGRLTAVVAQTKVRPVASNPRPALPTTVTDAQGNQVTVDDASRILALDLYGTTSRIVFELGLGDNLVGRDTSSAYPEIADRPLVTPSGHELSAEAILQLAPTLIVTDTSLGPWDVIEQLRDAGISVVVVDSHRSIENVGTLITQVGAAVGLPAEAARLAERTTAEIDAVVAEIGAAAPAEKPRVAFLYVRGQSGIYYLFGDESGADSLIEGAGGIDVASAVGVSGMKPLTAEALVDAQPDVVLLMTHGLDSVGGVDGLLEHIPALRETPAGRNRAVIDMADDVVLGFGSATPSVLEALAAALREVAA